MLLLANSLSVKDGIGASSALVEQSVAKLEVPQADWEVLLSHVREGGAVIYTE